MAERVFLHLETLSSPYINRFLQPDTIIPDLSNPQSWNRYSYVQNSPIGYSDPTGHWRIDEPGDMLGCSDPQYCHNNDNNNDDNNNNNDPDDELNGGDDHEPGESYCQNEYCGTIEDLINGTIITLDTLSLIISSLEFAFAGTAYATAIGACIATGGVGCGIALGIAFNVDVALAAYFGIAENTLSWASTGLTAANDIMLGNTGIDNKVGPYVGKDTVVSFRNSVLGSVPESVLDFAASLSQSKYDYDRIKGNKSGGYIPVFSKEFVTQLLIKDWL